MRYPPEHKAETIQKIVKQAGALAKKEGFGTTGLDALTKAAGLTTGAFYKHFSGKDELLEALLAHELSRTERLFFGKGGENGPGEPLGLEEIARKYLSPAHLAHPEKGCVLPALSAEISRAGEPVRKQLDQGLQRIHAALRELTGKDEAWAFLSMAVGAITLARASADPDVQEQILMACVRQLESMQLRCRQT